MPITPSGTIRTPPGGPPSSADAGELPRGTTLDRYVILKRLGRGGMGVVYLAFDGELERRVAIKVLRAEASGSISAGETRARLLREAQAMAKVAHAHVVSVYDVGTFADEVFVAMEYVNGATLREWCERAKPRARTLVEMYIQAGRGLQAAHIAGILHRDFKPENVLVDEQGHAKVLDFGLARLEALPGETVESLAKIALHETGVDHKAGLAAPLTRFGTILGTPAYMAPEQLVGEKATARSDQFAFCVALYEAIYGELPFEGESLTALAANIHAVRFRSGPGGVRAPRGLRRVLLRGLNGSPDRRFASMSDLLSALERAVRTPTHWLIAAAATLLAAAVITLVALRPAPPKMCRGAEEALAPAWGAAREDDVHRAFAKTGNARAEEAFSHVHSVVERYARSWVAMRTDACEATRVRGEQSEAALDLRMACLAQRERELKATVDLFANPDDKTIEKSVEAAAQLTPVESCGDLDSLRAPFAPPKDEGQRRAVDDLRQRLAELHVAFSTARLSGDPAVEQASALALEAAGVGYEPVHAEALYEEGVVERNLSKLALAQVTLFRAAIVAEAVRHDVLAAKAWTELLQVEGHDLRHFEESSRTGELAEAAVRRSSSDALRADLLCARAGVAYRSGAATDMRTDAEQCIRLRDRVLGSAHPDTLIAREELADALWDLGEVEASLPLYQSILETRRTLLGPTHPDTIRSLSDVGQIAFELGDYRAAIPILVEATGSPNLPFRHAYFETYLADALVGANRIDEGIATFAEAHSALMSLQGPLGEDLPALLADFSRFLVQREIDVQAESNANESLALSKATFGREQERGEALGVRALVEARRGATKRAIEDADGALAVKQKLLGERAEIVPLLARGLAYLATQREGDALVDLERAAGLGEKYKGDVAIRSEVRFALARALVATKGDAARASELATRAASELDSVGLAAQAETVRSWMRKSGVVVASSKP